MRSPDLPSQWGTDRTRLERRPMNHNQDASTVAFARTGSSQGQTSNKVVTHRESTDPRLRGRTYAIPYERVWTAALALAGTSARWTVVRANDELGEITAEARTRFLGFVDDVTVHIGLDADAQTRVDVISQSRTGKTDFGVNARRVGRFFRALDTALDATPELILAGT